MSNISDNAKNIFDNAKVMFNKAVDKGKDMAQITKLNLDITTLEKQIKDAKSDIGDIIIRNEIDIENEEIKENIKKIEDYELQINEKKNLIASLKAMS